MVSITPTVLTVSNTDINGWNKQQWIRNPKTLAYDSTCRLFQFSVPWHTHQFQGLHFSPSYSDVWSNSAQVSQVLFIDYNLATCSKMEVIKEILIKYPQAN
jgi:hypothetical protein